MIFIRTKKDRLKTDPNFLEQDWYSDRILITFLVKSWLTNISLIIESNLLSGSIQAIND